MAVSVMLYVCSGLSIIFAMVLAVGGASGAAASDIPVTGRYGGRIALVGFGGAAMLVVLAGVDIVLGVWLWKGWRWARIVTIVLAVLSVPLAPAVSTAGSLVFDLAVAALFVVLLTTPRSARQFFAVQTLADTRQADRLGLGRRSMVRFAGLMAAAALVAACSAPAPDGSPMASGGPVPEYRGPTLPGLAAAPSWAVTGGKFTVHAVGGSFAVIKQQQGVSPSVDGRAVDGTASVLEFRDAGTGVVRGSVPSPVKKAWTGAWQGRAALYVAFQRVQVSDGLSAERREQVVTAYDESGAQLGTVSRGLDAGLFAVVNGWLITADAGKQRASVADSSGTVRASLECTSKIACVVDLKLEDANLVEGSSRIPIVVGDLAFSTEKINSSDQISPLRLVATSLSTGQRAWSTATIDRPPGAVAETQTTGVHATPIRIVDGKLIVAWYTGAGTGFGDRGEILALHDAATGRLLQSGPRVGKGVGRVLIAPGNAVAVVADAPLESHSLAWELTSGMELWRQRDDEKPFIPVVILGKVLIGYTKPTIGGGGSLPIAVGLRTKEIIDADVTQLRPPAVADTGHAALTVDGYSNDNSNGVFVFAPAAP